MPTLAPLRRLRRRLRTLLAPDTAERALDDELRFHLEMEVEHNMRLGLAADDARRKATRELGDPAQWHRDVGTVGAGGVADGVARDVRLAARSLRRAPGFSLVAVATLALGIGVTTAVFSVVDGVLLRPLPYPEPERLVRLYERTAERDRISFPGADFHDVRREARTLRHVAFVRPTEATILGADEPLRARVAWTSREFFDVLGTRPALGRTARDAEGTPGGPQVAVVSDGFWRRALGADPDFARRTLRIGEDAYPIVGVMPPAVQYPTRSEVWVTTTDDNPHRTAHNWAVIGRLAPGATAEAAHAEVDGILRRLKAEHGEEMTADGGMVATLHADMARNARTTLLVLLGAVTFVLLVACVNLASANLARGETRQQEFAVRTALGAGRSRIVRQLLTENLLLAAVGGALGTALAWALTRLLVAASPTALPTYAVVRLDGRVLAFAAAAAGLTGLLVGLAPVWQVTRDLRGAIARGGRAGIDGGRLRARGVLIAAEVALALSLLAGAGLLVRSLDRLLGEELGFEPARVMAADVSLPTSIYSDTARIAGFFDRLLPELRAIPGVQSAGLTSALPLSGMGGSSSFSVDGGTRFVGSADYRVVDSSYFRTLGVPLELGRTFGAADVPGAEHVVVISSAAAREFWPDGSPLGHRVRFPGMDDHAPLWLTVVGVVGDVRGDSPAAPARPAMYVHYAQRPEVLRSGASVVVRGSGAPDALAQAIRDRVRALDANVPVKLVSMPAMVTRATSDRRFTTVVLGVFAALAVGLAALGIHGVLAYAVAQREREIGVRMALGAHRGAVRTMVLRDAMRAVLPGVAVGIVGGLALSRLLRGMLYGVSAADPVTFVAVAMLLTGVALVAAWLPARRATRVDPMSAIRAE